MNLEFAGAPDKMAALIELAEAVARDPWEDYENEKQWEPQGERGWWLTVARERMPATEDAATREWARDCRPILWVRLQWEGRTLFEEVRNMAKAGSVTGLLRPQESRKRRVLHWLEWCARQMLVEPIAAIRKGAE